MEHDIRVKFDGYPLHVQSVFMRVRALILDVAKQENNLVEETLKWGEPSYLTKSGSTVRIDWKEKSPEHFCLFFHCQTSIVASIKELYGTQFLYDGNRAIMFPLTEEIPEAELRHCIFLAQNYHSLKHLPLLGG